MKKLSLLMIVFGLLWISCQQVTTTNTMVEKEKQDENKTSNVVQNEYDLMKNSEIPKVKKSKDSITFLYNNYIVTTVLGEDSGEKITVTKKKEKSIIELSQIADYSYFYGISHNFLFLNQGTGPMRTLIIFDIEKEISNPEHQYILGDNGVEIKNDKIIIWEVQNDVPSQTKMICKDAEKWKEQGLTVLYQEKLIFDIATQKIERTKEFSCFAGQ